MLKKSCLVGLIVGFFMVTGGMLQINAGITQPALLEKTGTEVGAGQVCDLSTEPNAGVIYDLDQGTILMEYESMSQNQYQSLFSVSNATISNQDRHFHLYITPSGGFGMELRNRDSDFKYTMFKNDVVRPIGKNKIAFKADALLKQYKIFANGQLVGTLEKESFKFLSDITGLNNVSLGGTIRQGNIHYPFGGTIYSFRLYEQLASDADLIQLTQNSEQQPSGKLWEANNIPIHQGSGYDLSNVENGSYIKTLQKGTIVIKYKSDGNQQYQSLFSIGNKSQGNQDRHFHIYVTKTGGLGMELRNTDADFKYTLFRPAVMRGIYKGELATNTIAFKADPITNQYKLFANGKLIMTKSVETSDFRFINNIMGIDNAMLGGTLRNGSLSYPFSGSIENIQIYNTLLSDEQLIATTAETRYGKNIFKAGDATNANYFRIPTLLKLASGKIVSSIDARYGGTHDSKSNISIGFTASIDGGITWTDPSLPFHFTDYSAKRIDWPRDDVGKNKQISGSASFIDSVLLQERESGRLFLFADAMPAGVGAPNAVAGSGYKTVNGERYIKLRRDTDFSWSYNYSIRDNGVIYDDRTNSATNFSIDGDYNIKQNGEYLYQNQYDVRFEGTNLIEEKTDVDVKMNVFYKDAMFKVLPTNFLVMKYSDDEGLTWSDMEIMNKIKQDSQQAPLYCPGVGIQIKNGPYAGRLILSMYSGKTGEFGYLYSDDQGQNWSYKTTSLGVGGSTAEAQMIELPDGSLKTYMRTSLGKIGVITSLDGGNTWSNQEYLSGFQTTRYGTQLSVINYSGLIDGKKAILLSSPNATDGRRDGRIWIGLIEETAGSGYDKYQIDWRYSYRVDDSDYGYSYSCLTELPNGNIGVLYEKYDSWSRQELHLKDIMFYEEYTIDELKTLP